MENEERHTYEYDVVLDGDTAPAHVVRMVGKSKQVLEIGAGPGSITKHLQGAGGCEVTGLELDAEAIKILKPFCRKVVQANLNDADWPSTLAEEGPFDVVVAADVLEHVYDPWTTFKPFKDFLKDDGYIVISLPHVGHNSIIACLLNEDFEYRDWGLLDRTHIRFFGIHNIQSLFEQAGLKIVDAQFVLTPPEESEFAASWQKLTPQMRNQLEDNPFGNVYQVVVKAVPATAPGEAIQLASLGAARPVRTIEERAKSIVRSVLSPGARARIRRMLSRVDGGGSQQ